MIKKLFIALMAIAVSAIGVCAQNQNVSDANIVGHVIDAENGDHMPGCVVKINGTSIATVTDASGHYVFRDLKPGNYTLEVSSVGYVTLTRNVKVEANRTIEINFEVKPDAFLLDQVVVTSSKSEIHRRESPSLVNVLNSSTLQRIGACSLADGLDFQPGVRVEKRLPELRIHPGAHQRARRALLADTDELPTGVFGPYRSVWSGADSRQYDRPCGSDARRRLSPVRFISSGRHHQHHHKGPDGKLRSGIPPADVNRPVGVIRQQHHSQRIGCHRKRHRRPVHLRPEPLSRRL